MPCSMSPVPFALLLSITVWLRACLAFDRRLPSMLRALPVSSELHVVCFATSAQQCRTQLHVSLLPVWAMA